MATAYLIDPLFPTRRIHIIGGPSGSAKTTWLLQTLVLDWQHGREVMGCKSNPVPWSYIAADRTEDDLLETLERMHIPKDAFHYHCLFGSKERDVCKIIRHVANLSYKPKLIVIEGFAALMPAKTNINSYQDVRNFLEDITALVLELDITVIGVVHSPKTKEGEGYLNIRQKVLGSVAWAASCSTVVVAEEIYEQDTQGLTSSSTRRFYFLPRNGANIHVDYQFNAEGRLVEIVDDLPEALAHAFLGLIKPGNTFTVAKFDEAVQAPRITCNRIRKRLLKDGFITKDGHGVYRVSRVS